MKRILIIEDEPDIAKTMAMLVERAGYHAEYVLDPKEGLKRAKQFDLLLLDMLMPGMSGVEVLDEMKKRGIKTPTIVVSAVGTFGEVEGKLASRHAGVGFVSKTRIAEELISSIRAKIGK